MPKHIYALLVGIADYPTSEPRIPALKGPVHDIDAMEAFLRDRIVESEAKLTICALRDREATRDAILRGWQEHLGQAGADDVALFMFCGHGSRTLTAGEGTGYGETLVCWDSRLEGGSDLRDTEMSERIQEVTAVCPHLTLIFECCHAGSVHRGYHAARLAPPDPRPYALPVPALPVVSREVRSSRASVPVLRGAHPNETTSSALGGGYVMLAACQAEQLALELPDASDGRVRGVFAAALVEALRDTPGNVSYGELYQRVMARVRVRTPLQIPRFESTLANGMQRMFLGSSLQPRPTMFRVMFDSDQDWVVEGGLLQGVPGAAAGRARMALYGMEEGSEPLTEATVVQVLPLRSLLAPDNEAALEHSRAYHAAFTEVPQIALRVCVEAEGEDGLRCALEPHLLRHTATTIRPVETRSDADLVVEAKQGEWLLWATESDSVREGVRRTPLCRIAATGDEATQQVIERLERICHWRTLARLTPVAPSALQIGDVTLEIDAGSAPSAACGDGRSVAETETRAERIVVPYRFVRGRLRGPTLTVRLTNRTGGRLYAALLGLSEDYAIGNLLQGGCVALPPERTQTYSIVTEVPESYLQQGIGSVTDIFKLLVCRQPFDAYALEQPPLDMAVTLSTRRSLRNSVAFPASLCTLRGTGGPPPNRNDWLTDAICVTTVAPLPERERA